MMQDWNAYLENMMGRVGELTALSPELGKGLQTFRGAVETPGHLPAKMHSLIALAVAVTTRCDGCIATHARAAAENGATKEELAETLTVAVALNAGAAVAYSARVMDAFSAFSDGK